jgi:hypothetical protein
MRVPNAEDDLATPELGEFAPLAVDERLSEILKRSECHEL